MQAQAVIVVIVLLLSTAASPAAGQRRVSGTVLDGTTGAAVGAATVELVGLNRAATTDERGRFQFPSVPSGRYLLRITHVAYGARTDSITVAGSDLALAIRILPHAIRLDPLPAEAVIVDRPATSRSYVVTRAQIEAVANSARHLGDVIRAYIPGATVYETPAGYVCLEFRGARGARTTGCNFPKVIVDHVPIQAPAQFLRDTPPDDIDRIEFVPASAGAGRYGVDSQYGALVIRTRRFATAGGGEARTEPLVAVEPTYPGYRWAAEPAGHPWQRTMVASFIGNAAGIGAGLAALGCFAGTDDQGGNCLERSDGAAALGALTLPLIGAAVSARIFGATDYSRGTGFHSAIAAILPLGLGYAIYRDGENTEQRASRLLGVTFIFVGTPVAASLADGLFRRPRR